MDSKQILQELNSIFIKILDNEKIILTPETTAEDIAEWDSITHIELIVAIEKHFKIKYTLSELGKLKNAGEMVELISQKTN